MATSWEYLDYEDEPLEPMDDPTVPITLAMLEGANKDARANMLGMRMFPIVFDIYPLSAEKVTGMLIELTNKELVEIIQDEKKILSKAHEAIDMLYNHLARKLDGGADRTTDDDKQSDD